MAASNDHMTEQGNHRHRTSPPVLPPGESLLVYTLLALLLPGLLSNLTVSNLDNSTFLLRRARTLVQATSR